MQCFGPQVTKAEVQEGGVMLLTLGAGNDLFEEVARHCKDTSVRVFVITGQGDHFYKDADTLPVMGNTEAKPSRLAEFHSLRVPIIACINGTCRGTALSLALACDFRFAAKGAEIGATFANEGLIAEDATAYMLPELVGSGTALSSLFSGDVAPAEKLPPGLIQRIIPKRDLLSETLEFAQKFAAGASPNAAAVIKQQIYLAPKKLLEDVRPISARLVQEQDYELARELLSNANTQVPAPTFEIEPGAPWTPGTLKCEMLEKGVAVLTIGKTSTWSPALDKEFFAALNHFNCDLSVRIVVIVGQDAEFVPDADHPLSVEGKIGTVRSFCDIRRMRMPVIACINGPCKGVGLTLAAACDLRFASKYTKVGSGLPQKGCIAEDCLSHALPHLIGPADAMFVLLSGEMTEASKLPAGLIQKVFPKEGLVKGTTEFAQHMAEYSSPTAVAVIKQQTYLLRHRNLEEAQEIIIALTNCNLSDWNPDHAEGIKAFGSNQAPTFHNHNNEWPFLKLAQWMLSQPARPHIPPKHYDLEPMPAELNPFQCLIVDEQDDGVVLITLNKRTRMNAWGPDIDVEFMEALDYYDSIPSVRVIVVTGSGFFFCAGADAEFTSDGESLAMTRPKLGALRVFHDIRKMRTPVIAAVNGAACGIGLSLALACDIRFAANDAKIGVIFPQRALIAEDGTAYMFPQLCGDGDSLLLLMTGEPIPAEELPPKVFQRRFERKELLPETMAFAKKLAKNAGPASLAIIKQQTYLMSHRPFEEALEIAGRITAASRGNSNLELAEALAAAEAGREPNFPDFDGSLPHAKLTRELLGGIVEHTYPPSKPTQQLEQQPAPKAVKAVKAEPEKPLKSERTKVQQTGPNNQTQEYKVTCSELTIRKRPVTDSTELGVISEGERVSLKEETFDGWAKLADEDGWVRRCAMVDGTPITYLEPDGMDTPLLPAPEIHGMSARKFKVTFKPQVGVKAEPKLKAKVQAQKKFGEMVIAEVQTYDGWVRLQRNQGWILAVGSTSGKMLEPL